MLTTSTYSQSYISVHIYTLSPSHICGLQVCVIPKLLFLLCQANCYTNVRSTFSISKIKHPKASPSFLFLPTRCRYHFLSWFKVRDVGVQSSRPLLFPILVISSQKCWYNLILTESHSGVHVFCRFYPDPSRTLRSELNSISQIHRNGNLTSKRCTHGYQHMSVSSHIKARE